MYWVSSCNLIVSILMFAKSAIGDKDFAIILVIIIIVGLS